MDLARITADVTTAVEGLLAVAKLKAGKIVVVGCSTSEILGHKIGSASNLEVAQAVWNGIYQVVREKKLYLAVQCCEHLNRVLVTEEECAEKHNLEIVSVVPHVKAGGALATVAMAEFARPVVVEAIKADAGLDIGDTLIGMHLRRVAVPVRLGIKQIGNAHLTLARTRPPLVGGERARYPVDPGK